MKNILCSIAVVLLLLGSCDLKEEPYGFYSEDNFYKTIEDAQSSLLYAYNVLNYLEYSRSIFYIGELASETCDVKSGEAYGSQPLNNWTANANNETLTNFFKYCYIGINRANAVIDNLDASNFDETIKNELLGEAYFLRGYHYFNLARIFGLTPVQLEMVRNISQTSPSMAKNLDEMYDIIISDLRTAIALLEVHRKTGRADKVAAQAMLSKVFLTMASSKESNVPKYADMTADVQVMYDSAAFYASQVLYDQTEYALDTNLIHIYDIDSPDGPEHIFIMSMDRTGIAEGEFSKIGMMFHPWVAGTPYHIKNPDNSLTFISHGWEVFQTTSAFYSSYEGIDKRKTQLLVDKIFNEEGTEIASIGNGFTYPFTRKYADPRFIKEKSSSRPYLIRFSDIALVYAEAVGPTTEGYLWLNEIRKRAGLGDAAPGLSAQDFRNLVIQERAWELAFEGTRLYDLRRKAMVTLKDSRAIAAGISEAEAAFYPIPQQEIDLNTSID